MPDDALFGSSSAHAITARPVQLPRCTIRSPGSGARHAVSEAMAGRHSSAPIARPIASVLGEAFDDSAPVIVDEQQAVQKALYNGIGIFCTNLPEHWMQRPPAL